MHNGELIIQLDKEVYNVCSLCRQTVSYRTHPEDHCSFPPLFLSGIIAILPQAVHDCLKKPLKQKKNHHNNPITGYNLLKSGLIIKGLSSPSADHSRLLCLGTGKWTKFSKFLHVLACVWLPESVPHHLSAVFLEVVSSCQAETGNGAFGRISTICQARESSQGPGLGGVCVGNAVEWLAGILTEKSPLPPLPSKGIASLPPCYKWKTTKNENMTSPRPTIKSPQSQKAPLSALNLAALLPMGATVS